MIGYQLEVFHIEKVFIIILWLYVLVAGFYDEKKLVVGDGAQRQHEHFCCETNL